MVHLGDKFVDLFRNKKEQTYRISNPDPLTATPIIAEGVEEREDSHSLVQLRREIQSNKGIVGILARTFNQKKVIRVNLDEYGSDFWRLIDGERTLHEIEGHIRAKWQIDEKQNSAAVVNFTKMLMRRGLILLAVPASDSKQD